MIRTKRALVCMLCFILLCGGCLNLKQSRNKVEYYTLEYDPPLFDTRTPLPFVIRVERFNVAPEYNSDRIIYRDKSFKRDSYVYFRWRANPGDLVTSFLSRDIKQSGIFKAVLPYASRLPSSHLLEGSVDQFFEWDSEEKWEAVLSVSITLMAEKEPDISQKVLFQKKLPGEGAL